MMYYGSVLMYFWNLIRACYKAYLTIYCNLMLRNTDKAAMNCLTLLRSSSDVVQIILS